MIVEIEDFNRDKEAAIIGAANEEWPCDWSRGEGLYMQGDGESSLCGGESEEEFARRLTHAIWKANVLQGRNHGDVP